MFHLQIISPERIEFEGDVVSLIVPGEVGYLGILTHHAPLLTTLQDGRLTVRHGSSQSLSTDLWDLSGGGFLEVHQNKVIILARQARKSGDAESGSSSAPAAAS